MCKRLAELTVKFFGPIFTLSHRSDTIEHL
jgi:hypothetical protein